MKLQILSDLHIDSYTRRDLPAGDVPKTGADILLVAGDTANSDSGMPWLQEQSKKLQIPVVTITGNHEYFGEDVLKFDEQFVHWDNYDEQLGQGVKVLQCQSFDYACKTSTADSDALEEIRILGCTLWTDYQYKASEETIPTALKFMRDYKQIYAGEALFSPEVSMQIHAKQRQWLKAALQAAHQEGKKTVVMSHHSVSPLSVSQKYATLPSNAAFVSDFTEWMHAPWAPALWVHGHTHEAFDYQLGHTRVVVNPRAYPGEVSSTELAFSWSKVVEV